MNCNFVLLHRLSSYSASYLLFLVLSSSGWKELSRKASLEPRSSVFGMGGLFLFFLPSVSLLIVTFFRFCCSAFLTRFRSFLCSLCSLSELQASHPRFKYQFHHSKNNLKQNLTFSINHCVLQNNVLTCFVCFHNG